MTFICRASAADQTDITTMVPRPDSTRRAVLLPRPTGAGMADERSSLAGPTTWTPPV